MRASSLGLLTCLALATVAEPVGAQEVFLQNDSFGGGALSCNTGIGDQESLAARLTAAPGQYPYTINRIRVFGCGGGQNPYNVFIYQDDGGGVNPGSLIWQSANSYVLSGGGVFNDILMSSEPAPPPAIASGTVRVELYNVFDIDSIGFGTDLGGITSQRNFLRTSSGVWSFAETQGITGDWILRMGVLPPSSTLPGFRFHPVPPCRVVDTRSGSPLGAGADRTLPVAGACLVPSTARAVAVNLTVTQPTAAGFVTVFPAGATLPTTSSINYRVGQTRANNGIFGLGTGGALVAHCGQVSGTTHFILDVFGYFE